MKANDGKDEVNFYTPGMGKCSKCHRTTKEVQLYYVGGKNEDEPLCALCMCDALLSLRMKMPNNN